LIYLYIISVVVAIFVGFILRLPFKIDIDSFEGNVFFPTIVISLGLMAILEYFGATGYIYPILTGVVGGVVSKYINRLFPGVDYGN